MSCGERTNLLLSVLAGTLVLAVTEQFDNAALVGGEAGKGASASMLEGVTLHCPSDVLSQLVETSPGGTNQPSDGD